MLKMLRELYFIKSLWLVIVLTIMSLYKAYIFLSFSRFPQECRLEKREKNFWRNKIKKRNETTRGKKEKER